VTSRPTSRDVSRPGYLSPSSFRLIMRRQRPPLLHWTKYMYAPISRMPRPLHFSRFSSSVGSGTQPGSNPAPSSSMVISVCVASTLACTLTCLATSNLLPCLTALISPSSSANWMAQVGCGEYPQVLTSSRMRFCTSRAAPKSDGILNLWWATGPLPARERRCNGAPRGIIPSARCRAHARVPSSFREALHGVLPRRENPEQLVQLRDPEHLQDLRLNVRQPKLAILLLNPVIGVDEHSQRGRRQVIDRVEVEQQLGAGHLVDQGIEGVADLGDVGLVQDLVVGELDDADVLLLNDRNGRGLIGHVRNPAWGKFEVLSLAARQDPNKTRFAGARCLDGAYGYHPALSSTPRRRHINPLRHPAADARPRRGTDR